MGSGFNIPNQTVFVTVGYGAMLLYVALNCHWLKTCSSGLKHSKHRMITVPPPLPLHMMFHLEPQDDIGAEAFEVDAAIDVASQVVPSDTHPSRHQTTINRLRRQHAQQKAACRNLRRRNSTLRKKVKQQDKQLVEFRRNADWSCDIHDTTGQRQVHPVSRVMLSSLRKNSGNSSTRAASNWMNGKVHRKTVAKWEAKCGTAITPLPP